MQYHLDTGAFGGGILVYQSEMAIIRNNIISSNIADLWSIGVAAYAEESTIEMTNNLVVSNGAGSDPYDTMTFHDCQVTIRNLTLVDNTIQHGFAINPGSGTTIIENSIISNDVDEQIRSSTGTCTVRYSDVRDGWTGEGNIDADALFVSGSLGNYYLSQTSAGQPKESPCVDSGDPTSGLIEGTTRTDSVQDSGIIDMGYHYRPAEAEPFIVTGPGPAYENPPSVRIFTAGPDPTPIIEFDAYGPDHFGVEVSCGEVNGDSRADILTDAGPGAVYGPHIRGFRVDGTPLPGLSFLAYGTNKFGVNVAAGDIDGDGFDEIVTGAGPGAVYGPHVRGWDYDGIGSVSSIPGVSYFAYGTPKWGVNVSAGDIDGDGFDEILTGAGPRAVYGPHVRGWDVDGGVAAAIPSVSFLACGTNKYGVHVSCGDEDGDGIDEIVTGPGPGVVFGAHVRGWNFDGQSLTAMAGISFFAWQYPAVSHGANVWAGADLDGDGRDEIVVGAGPDPSVGTPVKVYRYDGTQVSEWFSLEAFEGLTHGATVAAGRY